MRDAKENIWKKWRKENIKEYKVVENEEKKEQLLEKIEKMIEKEHVEKCEMLRWITTYLEKNIERWQKEREERNGENDRKRADWEKKSRFEKSERTKTRLK